MKNIKLIYVVVGLLAISVPQLTRGQDTNKPGNRLTPEQREKLQNLSPEEREAKRKEFMEKRQEMMKKETSELGLNAEELQKLPPEERRAKVKAASEKKLTELEKKKTDGTITDSEKQTLQKLEMRKKFMEEHPGGFGGRGPGKPGAGKLPGKSDK